MCKFSGICLRILEHFVLNIPFPQVDFTSMFINFTITVDAVFECNEYNSRKIEKNAKLTLHYVLAGDKFYTYRGLLCEVCYKNGLGQATL